MDETQNYKKNVLNSRARNICIIIIIAVVLIGSGLIFYRYERNKLFNNISTNIVNLNTTVSSFKNGLNQNAEFLNPSFTENYQNDFTKLIADMQSNQTHMLNNQNSKEILSQEIGKAQYYDYMAQFINQFVGYKNDFTPLMNVMQNGGTITAEESSKIQNDLQALENSKELVEAMNIYNTENVYMSHGIKSPYQIKQNLINLNNSIKNGDFNKSTKGKAKENNSQKNNDLLVMNLI